MHNDMSTLFAICLVSIEMRPSLLYVKQFFGDTEHMVQSISCKVSINIQRHIAI